MAGLTFVTMRGSSGKSPAHIRGQFKMQSAVPIAKHVGRHGSAAGMLVNEKSARMMTIRNWFGLRCWLNSCPGNIDHDKHSVFWSCAICGKMDRAPARGDHWEPLP